jgi:hypothetical protein
VRQGAPAALVLLIAERDKLNSAIEALQESKTVNSPAVVAPVAETRTPKKKRQISAAARRNMALGQKKRYAALKAPPVSVTTVCECELGRLPSRTRPGREAAASQREYAAAS